MKIIPIKTAKELLDYFNPISDTWLSHRTDLDIISPSGWIFRGQTDHSWLLRPSAFRDDAFNDYVHWWRPSYVKTNPHYVDYHIVAELKTVNEFIRLADSLGIETCLQSNTGRIIADHINLVNENIKFDRFDDLDMPPLVLNEAFALAQHHGIPTRLLDWTYNPYNAIYFPCIDYLNNISSYTSTTDIAIWALNTNVFKFDPIGNSDIQILHVPYATNTYIKSQRGLFIYDSKANDYFRRNNDWPDFDSRIDWIWQHNTSKKTTYTEIPFYKITFPVSLVKEILQHLYLFSISPAHLMPTLDNVSKTVSYFSKLDVYSIFK